MKHIFDKLKDYLDEGQSDSHCRFLNKENRHLPTYNNFYYFLESYPLTKSYFAKIPKISFLGYNNTISYIQNIPFSIIRDGIWGVFNFFYNHPEPPKDNGSVIIVPYFCSKIIPEKWSERCLLYKLDYERPVEKVKELWVHGGVNSLTVDRGYVRDSLKAALPYLDKDCVIKPCLKIQNQKFFGEISNESENLVMVLEELNEIFKDFKIAPNTNVDDIVEKNYKGNAAFFELNKNATLNYDSYINYKLSSNGFYGLDLNAHEHKLKHNQFTIQINSRFKINIFEKSSNDKSAFEDYINEFEYMIKVMKEYLEIKDKEELDNEILFIMDKAKALIDNANEVYG